MDKPRVTNLWPSNVPHPVEEQLQQDDAENERLIANRDAELRNAAVSGNGLDPDLMADVQARKAEQGVPDVDEPTLLAKALDVPVQVGVGFLDAADAAGGLLIDTGAGVVDKAAKAGMLGENAQAGAEAGMVDQLAADLKDVTSVRAAVGDTLFDIGVTSAPKVIGSGEAKSMAGDISNAVGQFLLPFGAFGKLKALKGLKAVAPWTEGMLRGSMSTFVGFDEHEKRLSNLIQSVPALQNPITEFMMAKPDDGVLEGRLKNALEGELPGAVATAMFKGIRFVRDGANARKAIAGLRTETEASAQGAQTQLDSLDARMNEIRTGTKAVTETPAPAPGAAAGPADEMVVGAAKDVNPTVVLDHFMSVTRARESGGKLTAQNPNSSAYGPYQFTKGTWKDQIRKQRPDLASLPDAELYALRADPQLADEIMRGFTQENAGKLAEAGQQVTSGNLYLMHFFGEGDAIPVLRAADDVRIEDMAKTDKTLAEAIRKNKNVLAGKTVGQVKEWAAKQYAKGAKAAGIEDLKAQASAMRPDKQVLSIEAQTAMARATGLTVEELKAGGAFTRVHESGAQDVANATTLLQVETFQKTGDIARQYIQRGQQLGDMEAAADEFIRNQGAALLTVTGRTQDVMQELARGVGFRGHQPEVAATNQLLQGLNGASGMTKVDLMHFMANATDPVQVEALATKMKGKDWKTLVPETLYSMMYHSMLSAKAVLNDVVGTAFFIPVERANKVAAAGVGAARTGANAMIGRATSPDRVRMMEAAIDVHAYFGAMIDGMGMIARAARLPDVAGAGRSLVNAAGGMTDLAGAALARDGAAADQAGLRTMDGITGAVSKMMPFSGKVLSDAYQNIKLDLNPAQMERSGAHVISAENYGVEANTVLGRMLDYVGNVIHAPGDVMRTKDTLTKWALINGDAKSQAYRRATLEGLTGEAFSKRVEEIYQQVMDKSKFADTSFAASDLNKVAVELEQAGQSNELIAGAIRQQAVQNARRQTLTDELGWRAAAWKGALDATPGMKLFVPFFQTVTKTLARTMEMTPGVALAMRNVREDIAAGGARGDLALGRQVVGGGLYWIGAYLANAGIVTGSSPSNRNLSNMQRGTAWMPNSVYLNGKYIDLSPIQPLANFLTMPANMVQLYAESNNDLGDQLDKDMLDYVTMGSMAATKTIYSNTWLQPVVRIIDAINRQDGDGLQKLIDDTAAGLVVPGSVAYFGREVNPIVQDAEGLFETIKARAGEEVRPKRDWLGEPVKVYDQMTGLYPGKNSGNIEPDKLTQTLLAHGVVIGAPDPEIRDVKIDKATMEKVMLEMKELGVKKLLQDLVDTDFWKSLPDTEKNPMQGRQSYTKAGIAQSYYNEVAKQAKENVLSKDVTLQQRVFRYENNLRTMRKAQPGVDTMLQRQGFEGSVAPVRVNFGLGQGGNSQ